MNVFAKIAEGLGSWLTFEQRCGHEPLFCESYLAHPVGRLLQYRFSGRVLAEVEHPVLAEIQTGPGRKPRIDFAVTGKDGIYDLAVETKWVSGSPTLLKDIIKDIIRLELLLPTYAKQAIIILAGNVKDITKLFQDPILQSQPPHSTYRHLPSVDGHSRTAIYFFHNTPPSISKLYSQILRDFDKVEISRVIQMERSGPFPRSTITKQYQVYIWKIMPRGKKFKAEEYDNLITKETNDAANKSILTN